MRGPQSLDHTVFPSRRDSDHYTSGGSTDPYLYHHSQASRVQPSLFVPSVLERTATLDRPFDDRSLTPNHADYVFSSSRWGTRPLRGETGVLTRPVAGDRSDRHDLMSGSDPYPPRSPGAQYSLPAGSEPGSHIYHPSEEHLTATTPRLPRDTSQSRYLQQSEDSQQLGCGQANHPRALPPPWRSSLQNSETRFTGSSGLRQSGYANQHGHASMCNTGSNPYQGAWDTSRSSPPASSYQIGYQPLNRDGLWIVDDSHILPSQHHDPVPQPTERLDLTGHTLTESECHDNNRY